MTHSQEFLLTFFDDKKENLAKDVHGFVLFKYYNKPTNEWLVMVYTQESFHNSQDYLKTHPCPELSDKGQMTIEVAVGKSEGRNA
jgi:hypothetical protein